MTEDSNKTQQKKKLSYLPAVFGCLVVLALAMFLGVTLYDWLSNTSVEDRTVTEVINVEGEKMEEPSQEFIGNTLPPIPSKGTYTQEEVEAMLAEAREESALATREAVIADIQMSMESGKTVVESLRACFSERIVLASEGKYYFLPIRNDLKHNKYNKENLVVLDSGELQYEEKGKITSHKGVDVSKFQGEIDWEKVAADKVEFAIIRVGNRGYGGPGKLVEDESFETNIEGARAAGLKTGVYFYSQAINDEEMLEEAQLVLDKIAPYKLKGPVVIDVEKVSEANGRMNKLSIEERTRLVKLFCDTIKKAGYKPMIYHNLEMGMVMLNLKELESYDKWFAYYKNEMYYPYAYSIWQYSESGHVDGISTAVDMNIAFELWKE